MTLTGFHISQKTISRVSAFVVYHKIMVKKEVVHYPIFTNDPDYLKFSKTKFTDLVEDKDKKKDDE